jgi:hypothetical protein
LAPYLRTGHGNVPRIRHRLRPLARAR